MSDLTEKEFLEYFDLACAHMVKGRAYTQLVMIVKGYFTDPNNKSLGKLAEEYGVPYSLIHAIDSRLAQDYEQAKPQGATVYPSDKEPDMTARDEVEGVETNWIRQKTDELMCDIDSGDELANFNFLFDFAKQLLAKQKGEENESNNT